MLKLITLPVILGIFLYLSLSLLLTYPPVWPDEAYIADIARNLMLKGEISTNFWGILIPSADKIVLWYPPAMFYILAGTFQLFGFSIEVQRLVSVTFGVLTLIVFFISVKNLTSFKIAAISTFLLSLDNFFLKASRISRPEILVLFFGLLSLVVLYYLINHKARSERKSLYFLVGLLAAISGLIHFAGLIFGTAIFLHLLYVERKKLPFFVMGLTAPFAFWLPMLFNNLSIFKEQLLLNIQYRQAGPIGLTALFNRGSIYEIIITSLYLLISLSFIFFSKLDLKRNLSIILVLIFALSFEMIGKHEWYIVLSIPFVYLALILSLRKFFWIFSSLIILTLSLNLKIYLNMYDTYRLNNYSHYSKSILENIPDNKTVYVSAIPDPYYAFIKRGTNKQLHPPFVPTSLDKYWQILNESEFIVINTRFEAIFVGDTLNEYMDLNLQKRTDLDFPNYSLSIIELKPKEKRITPAS